MPRAFCVLVHEQKYDCKAKELKNNLKNYHVLVGPQEKITGMKEILATFKIEGAWEVIEREQAV